MAGLSRFQQRRLRAHRAEGFSLVEVIIAMGVLSVALLSLVGVFTMTVRLMRVSTPMIVAREKAREAVESVHAARDTGEFAWNSILNLADGGVFLNGPQPIRRPGVDGLVNTADDGAIETMTKPGADGILGTTDDEVVTLNDFTREVLISPLNMDGTATLNVNLRQVTVTVRFKVDEAWRTYRLVTFISSYS
ncbi:MAG TPA: prepilin-type N-terminal cleavage/methylation domain-containing protein [Vicinamibacterales bacterium]|nr:prepilin-type N-terminal cleavage/methylation domain-containing protein [Vicinamibacterales bacterium]